MRGSITLYHFKNYETATFPLSSWMIVTGANGTGKSNFLEALYTVCNGVYPAWRHALDMIYQHVGEAFVRMTLENSWIQKEHAIAFSSTHSRMTLRYQWENVTRSRYRTSSLYQAILFSPIEMNLLYLWPSLRRDFLDEILSLAHAEFPKIRREYLQVLHSRNALLKKIAKNEESRNTLDVYDHLFVLKTLEYLQYRDKLLSYYHEKRIDILNFIWKDIPISCVVEEKLSSREYKDFRNFLEERRDKELIIGYTTIGPHTTDFRFEITDGQGSIPSHIFLSRWENKSILFALKFLSMQYIEEHTKQNSIVLLDDMASELDQAHCIRFIESLWDRPFILTGHMIPESVLRKEWIEHIYLK